MSNGQLFCKLRSAKVRIFAAWCVSILVLAAAVIGQEPSPRSVLGFHPTTDKTIADWSQITDYFAKLDAASPRVKVREFGKTTLGKPMIAAFISSADNIRGLDKYQRINQMLADPRKTANAEELIAAGKTIVSISCSIHATEIVASQMSMNLAYELASAKDAETREILENTILILIPSSNPDGVDIVADWYRKTLGTKSEGTSPPELYHHYAGHDNNRDWFMMNLAETRAITKLYWQEWFPQIVYDVHQMGQTGARFVIPPFFDPPNPRIAPLVLREVGLIGYKMAADLQAKNIKGVATNTTFDTWWHGGFRSAPYYHNSIGILSEAASADLMSPVTITNEQLKRSRSSRGLDSPLGTATNHPDVWSGGTWRPSDIANLEMSASRSLLQMAAKFRPRYLRNFYELGRANLEQKPDEPEAFIIPAGQPNAETIARFIEILMWQGIEVQELTREIFIKHDASATDLHELPLGSFLVYVNQPQKNNILSLFERQEYPHRVNAAGEPDVPYDVAGWTLPLQMGVETVAAWEIRKDGLGLKPIVDIDQARSVVNLKPSGGAFAKLSNPLRSKPAIGLFQPIGSSMDEGWTRLVFDMYQIPFRTVTTRGVAAGALNFDTLVLPSIGRRLLVEGLSAENYPEEFAGGIGEKGIENLKQFVSDGGTLVCFDASCGPLITEFGLPIKNVLEGKPRKEFYNPGSVVRIELDKMNRLADRLPRVVAAYFISSSAFEVSGDDVRTVAKYAEKDALLSGWMLGESLINGKTAVAETHYGKGKIILFAFRPQHRGQTFGTFQLMFNALEK